MADAGLSGRSADLEEAGCYIGSALGGVAFGEMQHRAFVQDGVQHVKKGLKYPAVMGVGGWNDPRVAAWEPGKFVAALQQASTSGYPVFMKVNYDDGHFTEEKLVTFKNFAGQMSFMLWQTGHKDFQPVTRQ